MVGAVLKLKVELVQLESAHRTMTVPEQRQKLVLNGLIDVAPAKDIHRVEAMVVDEVEIDQERIIRHMLVGRSKWLHQI